MGLPGSIFSRAAGSTSARWVARLAEIPELFHAAAAAGAAAAAACEPATQPGGEFRVYRLEVMAATRLAPAPSKGAPHRVTLA